MTRLLHAESAADLREKLAFLNIEVSPRSAGRTTKQAELFSIAHLLSSLPSERFSFPLSVEHADRPDFVVTSNDQSIGIELTEAVPENVARASALRESGVGPKVFFVPRARPGEPPKSTAALKEEIKMSRPGPPWVGDAPEREWAEAMLHFANIKVAKAKQEGFDMYPLNWLLIYDNWPLPSVHYVKASSMLAMKFNDAATHATFDRVFVLGSRFLCEFANRVDLHEVLSPNAED
jgi:hypothetical protein